MPSQSPFRIEPTEEQLAILQKRARAHTAPYWEVVRAKIFLLASEGLANKEIAQALVVSLSTVEFHLSNTYAKLGIRSRAQLAGRLAAPAEPSL